jgi:HEAT repeat protein
MSRSLLAASLFLIWFLPIQAQESNKEKLEKQIAGLIIQLGDAKFEVREKAQKALIEIGKPALPRLREVAKGPDVEVAYRAGRIIREIEAPKKN